MKYLSAIMISLTLFGGVVPAQRPPAVSAPLDLYVLDFDNRYGDPRLEWLSKGLRDMIILRLEEEKQIRAHGAEKIDPFLDRRRMGPTPETGLQLASDNLLLMGSYRREGARLLISLQLFDMEDWSSLAAETVEAQYSDISALNTVLVTKVLELVRSIQYASGPKFVDEIALSGAQAVDEKVVPKKTRPPGAISEFGQQLPYVKDDIIEALDGLEEAMDVYAGYRERTPKPSHEGESYFREFQLAGLGPFAEEKASNTALFEDVIRRVAQNPYSAAIGDLAVVVDPYDNKQVYIAVPVSYSVKQTLVEDMLYSLPYEGSRQAGGLRTIRYGPKQFDFSPSLLNQIAKGDFRVIPVIHLYDHNQRLQALLVDSPENTWERYVPKQSAVKFFRQSKFIPLVAITTSGFGVDVRLETDEVAVKYDFDIRIDQLSRYAKVVVRFMKEVELQGYLRNLP